MVPAVGPPSACDARCARRGMFQRACQRLAHLDACQRLAHLDASEMTWAQSKRVALRKGQRRRAHKGGQGRRGRGYTHTSDATDAGR